MFESNTILFALIVVMTFLSTTKSFNNRLQLTRNSYSTRFLTHRETYVKMSIFEDAFRFFSNLNKEASAKHILIKSSNANEVLMKVKTEIESADDVSLAFSEIASKVNLFHIYIALFLLIFINR